MEKLNLHDSLRLYLPGLLLSMLIYYVLFDTLKEVSNVLLPAIFVGLLLDIITRNLHVKYFRKISSEHLFERNKEKGSFKDIWRNTVVAQIKESHPIASTMLLQNKHKLFIGNIAKTYLNRIYSSDDLYVFRSPKSFGILCFNSSIACFIGLLILVVHDFILKIDGCCNLRSSFMMCISLLSVGLIFLFGSRLYFIESLNKELKFWSFLATDNLKDIVHLIELYDSNEP